MASARAVKHGLALLACNFVGEVTDEKIQVWRAALRDVSDEALGEAVPAVIKGYKGQWLPPVAIVLEMVRKRNAPDPERLLREIDRAGVYHPAAGRHHATVEVVRELFGDGVAEAYGAAGGGSRLFASNETTREIAARDFAQALKDVPAAELPRLEAPKPKLLGGAA